MTDHATELELRKSVTVALPPADAFALYTKGIAGWWPLRTHSVAKAEAETVVFEPGVGGRIYEQANDGTQHHWGTVTVWEPPGRIVHTWHPSRPETTRQLVELRFSPDGDGTRLEIVHTGWEALGDDARATYESYDAGWDFVLGERYAPAASQ
jgi:uncharacterized protein YndB with AHSA1/START domain